MRIIDIIRACTYPIGSTDILYDAPKWLQNIQADKIPLPCAFLDHPINWTYSRVGRFGNRQEVYSPVLFFCDKSRPEFTQEQHNEIIDAQTAVAYQFITNLEAHEEFDAFVSEPSLTDVQNFYDQNVTGVILRFSLRLKPIGICAQEPFYPNVRLLENGNFRLLENLNLRNLE